TSTPNTQLSWNNLIEPLEDATEALSRSWGVVSHLNSVADTPELRAAYGAMLPQVTAFFSDLGQNLALYERFKVLQQSPAFKELQPAQQKVLENSLRDFRLGGAELAAAIKPRFAAIQDEQAQLGKAFSDHVLDATDGYFHHVIDQQELHGIPADALAAAADQAKQRGLTGWIFTLHFPSYYPVQQYAENRALRRLLCEAYLTRASELGPQYGHGQLAWDNTENMLLQLRLRHEEAQLLGYENYAALSLAAKMAGSVSEVENFLKDIARRAKPFAQTDWDELQDFAKRELNLGNDGKEGLQPWDIPFASEKLKQARYAFSVNQKDGQTIAYFYLDPYSRSGKRGGAWMDDARGRRELPDGSIQIPVAYLVCNFPPPIEINGVKQEPTITHDDVITLFHESGHGMHHLLTQVGALGVSGINGVEWDAVELPSQFMENFCWEWDVVKNMTAHIDTKAPLPKPLFDKMLAAKNYHNGLGTLRQIVLSLTDWYLHANFDAKDANHSAIIQLAAEINQQLNVLPQAPISRWPNSFSHIFAGGYAAGYYSYKWAEVLSADVYSAFEDAAKVSGSVLDTAIGALYRQEILAVGGSRPAAESFKAFRGREPSIDALLRHGGLTTAV
ncbi:MAG: M3 family peptidase, partial [Burkholderiaceae bacterium]|nr:M3 family peptidase [Burkholderiaceae bacterium]